MKRRWMLGFKSKRKARLMKKKREEKEGEENEME